MRRTRSWSRSSPALALLASLCLACGSGGGGGGGGGGDSMLEAFAGTWHYAAYIAEHVPPNAATVTADFGTADGDGAGGLALTHRQNVNTAVGGLATDTGLAYQLKTSGALSWTLAPPASEPALGGILSGDGRMGLLTAITVGSVPSVRLLLRREGSFSSSTLSGDYHTVSIAFLDPSDIGYVGTTTFDGSGSSTGSGTTNREGLHQSVSSSATYTVTPEGDLSVTNPTIALEGGILLGGDVAVVSGGTASGQTTTLRLYVRESTSASLLTFAGTYHACFLAEFADEYATMSGTLVADGAGGWTADLTLKMIGGLEEAPAQFESGTYTVAPDGGIGIYITGAADAFVGGLSPDGTFATAGGPLTGSTGPWLWVLVRE